MATTCLMPLHAGRKKTVGNSISCVIDYVENPDKTDDGRLITSWECNSRIARSRSTLGRLAEYVAQMM